MRVPLLVCALLLTVAALGSAQDLKPEMRTGYDLFRSLLGELELSPVPDFDALGGDYSNTVLISLGDPSWLGQRPQGFLREFVRQGGALLVATDHSLDNPVWRPELTYLAGAWVEDASVVCIHQDFCYEGKPELPILVPAPMNQGGPPLLYSLFDARRVATSLPGHLRILPPGFLGLGGGLQGGVKPIAYLPEHCTRLQNWNPERREFLPLGDSERLLGVAGLRGQGRLVLLADHHLFMNDLMVREDLQNYEFTAAALGYLREGPNRDEKRTRCLFLENGVIQSSFEVPLEDLSEFPWEALRREARKLEVALGVMEEKGEFHKLLWKFLGERNITPYRVALGLTGILTLLGGLYLVYRLLQARAPHEAALPRVGRSIEKQVPTTRLIPQRRDEMLELGRLHEPARHLARTLLQDHGCESGSRPPEIRVVGSWWHRWTIAACFRRVWKIAFGVRPVPISAHDWPRFLRDLDAIRQGFLEGSIHIESVPTA